MKKRLVMALCSTLAVATALPAFALTVTNEGFFRVKSIMGNYTLRDDGYDSPDMFVDQRFRDKITFGINDYIKIVYFGEIDFQWGDASYANGRNDGGAIGGDNVNLETKNLYVEAKIPNTALTVTAGLQGYADNEDWAILNNDFAGFKFAYAGSNWSANAAWFKLIEESGTSVNSIGGANNEDDVTLWAAQFSMLPTKALKIGADFYYFKNQGTYGGVPAPVGIPTSSLADERRTEQDLYWLALNASYKMPMMTISGWAAYTWGKMKDVPTQTPMSGASFLPKYIQYYGPQDDLDVSGWVATVKADFVPAPGMTAMARLLYFSADDDATDTDQKFFQTPFLDSETAPFLRDGLMLMMPDAMGMTYPAQTGFALRDAAYKGYGLFGVVANTSYTPPTMKQMYFKAAAGWFTALEDDRNHENAIHDGKNIGVEVNGRVGYVFAEKFDVSLNGAYAFLGDFYKSTVDEDSHRYMDRKVEDGEDPSNPYALYVMVNVAF